MQELFLGRSHCLERYQQNISYPQKFLLNMYKEKCKSRDKGSMSFTRGNKD